MKTNKSELATFGAGCFWGVEENFSRVDGVVKTSVGYMGGDEKPAKVTYEMVCSDKTGHAEVVQVEFDSQKVSYSELIEVFWQNHDPTTLNRQGVDVGSQYRSVIFYHSDKQKREAIKSKEKLQKKLGKYRIVVTEIKPAGKYYLAEEYHQQYLKKKGLSSCHF